MSAASHKNLHWKILTALVLGFIVGLIINSVSSGLDGEAVPAWTGMVTATSGFIGKLFIQGLKMIVIPLIVSSIILAVMNIGGERNFGRLGIKTLIFYLASGFVAVVIGLGVVNMIQPGNVDEAVREQMLAGAGEGDSFMEKAEGRSTGDIIGIFLRMVPTNIVAAATNNEFLALIFFSLIFGYAAGKLPDGLRKTQESFWEGINKTITMITNGVIWFAPIGVFGLVVPTIASTGADLLGNMLKFAATVFLALGIHAFFVMPLVLFFVAKENPVKHFKAMLPALLTAFSTASSSSTLPLTTDRVQKGAGVSPRISGFTLPLGATVNMDGTALFECVVVIFLAQLFGVEMSFITQFNVVLLALFTSVGVAGIPSASLVAIVLILTNVGFSQEMIAQGIGIVFVVDRILDMSRTAVNVFGDSCAAVVIGKSEGETGYYPEQN
ncbi:MAG: dicarboxylate/amino acid:cation symporter [Verrucomicrobiota bacterium]